MTETTSLQQDLFFHLDADLAAALASLSHTAEIIRTVYRSPRAEKYQDENTQKAVQRFFDGYNAAAEALAELAKANIIDCLV